MTAPHAATKTTPDDLTVTPRDIHFATQAASGKAWLGGDPVATAVFNAMSLTFPDGERLFMDAVRHYRGELKGKLLEDAKAFIKQEAIHSREHVALNGGLDRDHYPIDLVARISATAKAQGKPRPLYLRGPDAKPQTGFAVSRA